MLYWEGYFKYEGKTYWAVAHYIVEQDALPEAIEYEIYDHKDHEVTVNDPAMVTCLEYKIADDIDVVDTTYEVAYE